MKDKIFGVLQRVGRSFMLPIAILPIAGILLGIGSSLTNETTLAAYRLTGILGEGTILHALFLIMNDVANVIFDNLPLLFAVGVALGMAKKEKEVAALAAVIAFFVMHSAISACLTVSGDILADGSLAPDVLSGTITSVCGIQSLQVGVFGGVIVGLGVAALHNRFYQIQLPGAISFFAGTRFVPIISTVVYMFVGILLYFVWPTVQNGIYALGGLVTGSGYLGTLIFGFIKRLLIPFGLHHVFYMPFWQTAVGGTMEVAGQVVEGGQNIFFAQLADSANVVHFSADATRYFSGEFIFMIFGLPGAALAMYHTARPEKKKEVGGLLISAALASMFTGITEPIEFSFLFVAPVLFGVQVVLAGSAYMIAHILNIAVGLTFSGGLIDLFFFGILQGNSKTSWLLIIPCGIVYFILYYVSFRFLITKFNFKTPGREDDDEETKLYTKADVNARREAAKAGSASAGSAGAGDAVSALITQGLGGKKNISDVDCCATRLRITVFDSSLVDDKILKSTGASGVIHRGTGVQVVYGPNVTIVKSKLEDYLESPASDAPVTVSAPTEASAKENKASKSVNASIYSPIKGKVISLEEVADGVFSEGMLGQGAAVEPEEGKVFAPFDGEVSMVYDTKHALGLMSKEGVELLIHVGLDTVQLNGKCFDIKVSNGQKIKKGDLLATVDLEGIKKAGYRTVTPIIVTNSDDYKAVKQVKSGQGKVGDKIISVE
ncbi:MAG: glucose PTS transporter subunit IIA [Clostridiales bacterium]|nr:glucose PTS transporter subunit IIA [Clostridiales bacterium]